MGSGVDEFVFDVAAFAEFGRNRVGRVGNRAVRTAGPIEGVQHRCPNQSDDDDQARPRPAEHSLDEGVDVVAAAAAARSAEAVEDVRGDLLDLSVPAGEAVCPVGRA